MKKKLKLGTRKSLLAWSQSQWVADQLQARHPDLSVQLVGIETRGDRILDVSLSKIEGKEFFVAELDEALASGKVDFTVHSLKDLSLNRPPEFTLGAIPQRENPRDVILFGPQALSHLQAGKSLRVGTSSPRRLENIPPFLARALPQGLFSHRQAAPEMEFVEIRGNVNTRLSRVHEAPGSERYLDAVVLAFAGLIRLWANPQGQSELKRLLTGVRWMVLPLQECPAAPGQGALAVECRTQDSVVIERLNSLHHEPTAQAVRVERDVLAQWGGGCHQRLGATAQSLRPQDPSALGLGNLLWIRGRTPEGKFIQDLRWNSPWIEPRVGPVIPWDGSQWRKESVGFSQEALASGLSLGAGKPVFVAHSRALEGALHPILHPHLHENRIWTSGVSSWFKLAQLGYWVEGCAEGLGWSYLSTTLVEPVLQLGSLSSWVVLTHQDAVKEWTDQGIQAMPTYQLKSEDPPEARTSLQQATHVFWSSGSQYEALKAHLRKDALCSCGPGKTAKKLRESGIEPLVFPTVQEWRKWVTTQSSRQS
ncbi:MAG: hydroxymethylbilane synthase [Bdellovibrionia bacterium]